MSRLMTVLGIVFLAIGAAIAVVGLARPGQVQVSGITMDTAALLLMTGIIALGFGGVIEAMRPRMGATMAAAETVTEAPAPVKAVEVATPAAAEVPAAAEAAAAPEEVPARIRFPGFGRKPATEAAATATAAAAVVTAAVAETPKTAVDETINALEKAKQDIASALGGVERISTQSPPPAATPMSEPDAEDLVDEEAADDDGELYVVEEKIIRGRPARILSDDTVEAETDEGWMRFENLEHLNEYLDAAEA